MKPIRHRAISASAESLATKIIRLADQMENAGLTVTPEQVADALGYPLAEATEEVWEGIAAAFAAVLATLEAERAFKAAVAGLLGEPPTASWRQQKNPAASVVLTPEQARIIARTRARVAGEHTRNPEALTDRFGAIRPHPLARVRGSAWLPAGRFTSTRL